MVPTDTDKCCNQISAGRIPRIVFGRTCKEENARDFTLDLPSMRISNLIVLGLKERINLNRKCVNYCIRCSMQICIYLKLIFFNEQLAILENKYPLMVEKDNGPQLLTNHYYYSLLG